MKIKPINITLIISIIWQTILYLKFPGFIWEDGFMIPWFTSKGLRFYQDFSGGSYFPLLKLIMIPVNSLFGWDPKGTVVLGFVLILLANYLIYLLSKKYLKSVSQIIPLIFFNIWTGFILQQNTFEINLFLGCLILIHIYLLLKWNEILNNKLIFLMGFISSFAIFSQQMTIISMGILFLILIGVTLHKKNSIFKVILIYLIGFIFIPTYLFYWFYTKGLLSDFYYWNILYYFRENGYPFNRYFSAKDIFMLSVLSLPVILQTIRLIKNKKNNLFEISFWLIIISSIAITLLAVLHPRRYLYFLPTISLLAGHEFRNSKKIIRNVAISIFCLYLGIVIIPKYYRLLIIERPYEIQNLHHPGDKAYEAISWIKDHSSPNDRVFSFETMIAYYEMQRLPAINRTYILPWAFEPFGETKKMIEKNNAKYWLVSELMFGRFTQLGYKNQADYIRNYLNNNYIKVVCFDWACVYEKKSR